MELLESRSQDDNGPNPARADDTIALLGRAYSILGHQIVEAVVEAGFPHRPAHSGVLAHIDRDGTRPSELARRANITPQAMGELVDDVERLGYVTREPDPNDRRAKLIVLTPRGVELERAALQSIASIESRLADLLGGPQLRQLRESLHSIVSNADANRRK